MLPVALAGRGYRGARCCHGNGTAVRLSGTGYAVTLQTRTVNTVIGDNMQAMYATNFTVTQQGKTMRVTFENNREMVEVRMSPAMLAKLADKALDIVPPETIPAR